MCVGWDFHELRRIGSGALDLEVGQISLGSNGEAVWGGLFESPICSESVDQGVRQVQKEGGRRDWKNEKSVQSQQVRDGKER